MATTTGQRVGIWIIAIVLTVGTVAGFAAMILAPQNEAADSKRLNDLYAKYQKATEAYTSKTTAQQTTLDNDAKKLSAKYADEFIGYKSRVGKYDLGAANKKLVVKDLKKGTGEVIGDTTTYAAYYVGWIPSGKIFDGSIKGSSLKSPLIVRPGGVIVGWTEGTKGMKIGGIREITIPAAKGYGNAGQGDIPANSPLKFIVMPIKTLETLEAPEYPQELLNAYGG
ncbi:MAG TPA: FKBP-type peptidyl-prolyl cis-trans isomerase [Candidatus Saccharibacteria bacterium]|nr:FKBP-type peptidyl-prolyl cis-trans isomerase [Candidatus Saccharibacteria bacterium]